MTQQKNQDEDLCESDFLNGVNHLFINPSFNITSCYSTSENTLEEELNGKLISINNGLISLIKIPNEPPLTFVGLIEISEKDPDHQKLTNNEEVISLINNKDDVNLIDYETLLQCKTSPAILQDVFDKIFNHLKENEEYTLQFTKGLPKPESKTTKETLLTSFLKFIEFIEIRIYPKI